MKTKACQVEFRGYGTLTLPEGLQVSPMSPLKYSQKKLYFLDEFPESLFPKNSMILHDAIHYGVVLNQEQVQP